MLATNQPSLYGQVSGICLRRRLGGFIRLRFMPKKGTALFKGRHFKPQVIVSVRAALSPIFTQLPRPRRTPGRAQSERGSRYDWR